MASIGIGGSVDARAFVGTQTSDGLTPAKSTLSTEPPAHRAALFGVRAVIEIAVQRGRGLKLFLCKLNWPAELPAPHISDRPFSARPSDLRLESAPDPLIRPLSAR